MNKWRPLIAAFWIFVAVMLIWQAYNYNGQVAVYHETHPERHLFYNPGGNKPPSSKGPAPDIRQVAYRVIPDMPESGYFTVQFTVKNQGDLAATGIQVDVSPYRGVVTGDDDNNHVHRAPIPASSPRGAAANGGGSVEDPTSGYGQWVSIPDLAPGQSSSNSVTFVNQPGMAPNEYPHLNIIFAPVKAK